MKLLDNIVLSKKVFRDRPDIALILRTHGSVSQVVLVMIAR